MACQALFIGQSTFVRDWRLSNILLTITQTFTPSFQHFIRVDDLSRIRDAESGFKLTNQRSLRGQIVILGTLRSTTSTSTTCPSKQKNFSCKTKRMNNFYSPLHPQHFRPCAYNITQYIFRSSGRRLLAEWNKLLLKSQPETTVVLGELVRFRRHKTNHKYQAQWSINS